MIIACFVGQVQTRLQFRNKLVDRCWLRPRRNVRCPMKTATVSTQTLAICVILLHCALPGTTRAQIPDFSQSFFVPQSGSVASPTEGAMAAQYFRACPNNDGGLSLPNNARIKVVARDGNGNGMPNISAADICILFNGGTAAQGLYGVGADSIIANSTYNSSPLCPDVRCVQADQNTDFIGVTYITFAGSTPGNPGVATRDPQRKWGHYDTELPVFILGWKIQGRITTSSMNGTYTLRIKNIDHLGGLGTAMNMGEVVASDDFSSVANHIGVNDALSYWRDFNSDGSVTSADFSIITQHQGHDCDTPNNP